MKKWLNLDEGVFLNVLKWQENFEKFYNLKIRKVV